MYSHALLGHVNNLYNTAFWALVHSGLSPDKAEANLKVHMFLYTFIH